MFVLACISQVSQKLMVQGYSGHVRYKGGIDVVQKIMKSDGIRGLYRGFGLSVLTYAPQSAVWWASYGSSQRFIWRYVALNSSFSCVICWIVSLSSLFCVVESSWCSILLNYAD